MKRNLTIQLDEDVVKAARILAARRETSISRLVTTEIERLVEGDSRYHSAAAMARSHLDTGFHLGGGPLPHRSELYDR